MSDAKENARNYVLTDNAQYLVPPLEHLQKKLTKLKEDEKLQRIIPDILTADLDKYLKDLLEIINDFKSGDSNKIRRFENIKNLLTMALNSYLSDMEKSENKIKRTLTTDFPLSREYSKEKQRIIKLMKELEIPRQSNYNRLENYSEKF